MQYKIVILFLFFFLPSKSQVVAKDVKLNRVWMLVNFKNFTKENLIKQQAFLDLTHNKKATAQMGCNTLITQTITKKAGAITFLKIASTEKACLDMQLEQAFIQALPLCTNYSIKGQRLILSNKQRQIMVFVAQDWD